MSRARAFARDLSLTSGQTDSQHLNHVGRVVQHGGADNEIEVIFWKSQLVEIAGCALDLGVIGLEQFENPGRVFLEQLG